MNYVFIQTFYKNHSKFKCNIYAIYFINIVLFTKHSERTYENVITSGRKSVTNFSLIKRKVGRRYYS